MGGGFPPYIFLRRLVIPMFDKIIEIIYDKFLDSLVKILGIILVLTVLLQVGNRLLISRSLPWTEELSRFSFIWFCFLGSVITLKKGKHLGIEIFYRKIPNNAKKYYNIFIYLFTILFGYIITRYGYEMIKLTTYQKSPILRWPMAYVYAALPVTGILYIFYTIYEIYCLTAEKNFESFEEKTSEFKNINNDDIDL